MPMTIDWPNKIIYPDRAEMVQVQSSPIAIYQLDVNTMHQDMRNLEDDEEGIWADVTHNYKSPTTLSGVTYARLMEIINDYTVTFLPDNAWVCQIVGGNSNVGDRVNPNNVSVQVANSAGLQDAESLQAASFGGEISIDTVDGISGTAFPRGTRQTPVNNLSDALSIAQERGINTINVMRSMTLSFGDFSDGYIFRSDTPVTVSVTLDPLANVTNCEFSNLTVTGTLDGGNVLRQCNAFDINYVNGFVFQTALSGTFTLGGAQQASFLDCWSNVASAGAGQDVTFDMGGSGNSMAIRNYSGAMKLTNSTSNTTASIDVASGSITIDSTVSGGNFTLRGNARVVDNSTGATIDDQTINKSIEYAQFQGQVAIDATSGITGIGYPNGTREAPVDNLADALVIAAERGLDELYIIGDYTFQSGDDVSLFKLVGQDPNVTTCTFNSGSITAGTRFEEMEISGTLVSPTEFTKCHLMVITGNTIGPAGRMTLRNCVLHHTVTLSSALVAEIEILECSTGTGLGDVVFDVNGADVDVSFHNYSGATAIRGMTNAAATVTMDIDSGSVNLDSSNTAGVIDLRGNAKVIDNSAGTTVLDETINKVTELPSFDGKVLIDTVNGSPGTVFPAGTALQPVDNLADAQSIAVARGFNRLAFQSDYVMTGSENFDNYVIEGFGAQNVVMVCNSLASTVNTEFSFLTLTGSLAEASKFRECSVSALTLTGSQSYPLIFRESGLAAGGLTLSANMTGDFVSFASNSVTYGNQSPPINFNGMTGDVLMTGWAGAVTLQGLTEVGKQISINIDAACITLDASNTQGNIEVRGVGDVVDNSTATVTDRSVDGPQIRNPIIGQIWGAS